MSGRTRGAASQSRATLSPCGARCSSCRRRRRRGEGGGGLQRFRLLLSEPRDTLRLGRREGAILLPPPPPWPASLLPPSLPLLQQLHKPGTRASCSLLCVRKTRGSQTGSAEQRQEEKEGEGGRTQEGKHRGLVNIKGRKKFTPVSLSPPSSWVASLGVLPGMTSFFKVALSLSMLLDPTPPSSSG